MLDIFQKSYRLLTARERKGIPVLLTLMIVGMLLETLGIGLVIPAIALFLRSDLAIRYPQLRPVLAALGNPTQMKLVVGGMISLVGIYFIKTVFLSYLVWRQTRFAYDVQANLSQRLFTTYLRQPYTFHLQRNSSQLLRNAITEVNQFTFSVMLPGLLIVTEGLVLVGLAALLLSIEPVGAVIVAVLLGSAAAAFHRATRTRIARWGSERQNHEGLRVQHLQQGLGGAKDVKLLGRETEFLAQYRFHNERSVRAVELQVTLQQIPRLGLELLGVVGLATLVLTMLARGREMADIVPAVGLFAAAAFRLMPSVNRVLMSVQALRYGVPATDTLLAELSLSAPELPSRHASTPVLQERIQLVNAGFAYPGASNRAIDNVSLSIQRGECVGVVGPSGAGKSTLVDIVLGLLVPTAGAVMVDGQDVQLNLRAWQDQIGYVPQSVYLTDDSLRRNVAFGLADEQIDNAAVVRAVKAAQLEEFVGSLTDGLDALVGERGVRISGGQRQRIGIARALYHDPEVLVLDEATSALDTVTEVGVMKAVAALQGRKTILIVAHRPSTVAQCDKVYRLEQGRVSAQGRPADILRVERAV